MKTHPTNTRFKFFRRRASRSMRHFASCAGPGVMTLLTAVSSVSAAAPDTSTWECKYCPFEEGYGGSYDVGVSHVSDDAARYGNGTGYDESGAYALLDGDGAYAGDGLVVDWEVADLGVASRAAAVELARPGVFDMRVGYRALPYRLFDSTATVFSAAEDFSLVLPDDWVRADLTSDFSALQGNLVGRNIETDRDILQWNGRYRATPQFTISANYQRQRSDGVQMTGGSFFTNASLLPQTLDHTTDEVDLAISWQGERAQASVGYYLSLFQNKALATTWDNPFNALPGADAGSLAQAPDNRFSQLTFNGSLKFAGHARASVSGAIGSARQDDALLPYSVNPLVNGGALPRTTAQGKVETRNFAASLSARPATAVGVTLKYRYDDRDNQTPLDRWSRIITDSLSSGADEVNIPYSFSRSTFDATLTADLRPNLALSGGFEREQTDRDFQEVASQSENTGWGKVRWQPLSYASVSVRGGTAKRKVNRYDTEVATSLGQNPLLRKYNLAHRFREFGELLISASLPEKPVTVSASAMVANDDYSKSQLGLLSSDEVNYAADLSWAPAEKVVVYVNASLAAIEADQAGSAGFSAPDWTARGEDEFLSIGAGAEFREIAAGLDLSLDYSHGVGNSDIAIRTGTDNAQPFPQLESTLDSARLALTWNRSAAIQWRGELRYEQFETRNWALQGVGPATIPTVLTLGAAPYDYEILQVAVRFHYRYSAE